MSKTFSKDEVANHKTPQDLYIIVDDDVYDLTEFQSEHPGGQKSKEAWKPPPVMATPHNNNS